MNKLTFFTYLFYLPFGLCCVLLGYFSLAFFGILVGFDTLGVFWCTLFSLFQLFFCWFTLRNLALGKVLFYSTKPNFLN